MRPSWMRLSLPSILDPINIQGGSRAPLRPIMTPSQQTHLQPWTRNALWLHIQCLPSETSFCVFCWTPSRPFCLKLPSVGCQSAWKFARTSAGNIYRVVQCLKVGILFGISFSINPIQLFQVLARNADKKPHRLYIFSLWDIYSMIYSIVISLYQSV